MDTEVIKHFKELLEAELIDLEKSLSTLGRKNPDRQSDWEAVEPDGTDEAEEGDVAENMEAYENNRATLEQLETRLNEVKTALSNIEDERYGICEVCENEIEMDRLEANPAASTCKAHM